MPATVASMSAMAIAIVVAAVPSLSGAVIGVSAMIPIVVSGIGASDVVRLIGVIAVIGMVRMLGVAVGAHVVTIAMAERKARALEVC